MQFLTELIIFIFGILALICLYVGHYSNKNLNRAGKAFGYVFSGSFILLFGWFLAIYLRSNFSTWGELLKTLFYMESLLLALSIPFSLLVIYCGNKSKKKWITIMGFVSFLALIISIILRLMFK